MKETILSRSLRAMYSGKVVLAAGLSTVLLVQPALAQEAAADTGGKMQRVEVTGSSIKRIAVEGALPVQTLTKQQIEQSGATSVADLVAWLPSMQGFTTASASVNGGGGGLQTASLHGIGEGYTLVLLNGRRIAPATSGSTVNLGSIPLAAVERVEILTDGANTLYGSDAIAGVINFILKKNQTDLNVEGTFNSPIQSGGGKTTKLAISKGWGDIETDGFNILVGGSHEDQKALLASDRGFSSSGVIPFTENGKRYSLYQLSSNSIPGNATVRYGAEGAVSFAPNLLATGKCNGPLLFQVGRRCLFDYAATVQSVPQLTRDSVFGSANYKLNADTTLFAEAMGSRFTNKAAYAPGAQPLGIPVGSALYNKSILPYLAQLGVDPATVTSATMNLRLVDSGLRTDKYKTVAEHLVLGVDGNAKGWDYNAAYTHSENTATDTAAGGYMSLNAFDALINSGAFDPFAPSGTSPGALKGAILTNEFKKTKSKIDVASVRGSTALFDMAGGKAQLGVGGDFTKQQYSEAPDAISQGNNPQQPTFTDAIVGGSAGALPVDAKRDNWGAYAELLLPVIKNFDVTASTRYDKFDAVSNGKIFDEASKLIGSGEQGKSAGKATYKLAARWNPTETLLLRGSYGTGFKAPVMTDIVTPLSNYGSSAFHSCPITATGDPRLPLCNPGSSEYSLLRVGNAGTGASALKPETSKQASIGFRLEPISSLSIGFDLWDVKIKDQIQYLSEDLIFNNPATYNSSLVSYYDPIQKQNVLAAVLAPFNLASSHFRGIDFDHTFRTGTPIGKLAVNWSGSYMLKSEQEVPNLGVEKNIGRFNSYSDVTFRFITKAIISLRSNDYITNSLTANYRSGYVDQEYNEDNSVVREVLANGTLGDYVAFTRKVASYTTLDWQARITVNKSFVITGGIKNFLDRDPPFTVRNAGGGNASGFDGRYADPLGRQAYLSANYKF